jgi:uncharacterized protein
MGWYLESAKGGDGRALNSLGLFYVSGEVVRKNLTKAMELFHEASDKGISDAYYNLGILYYKSGKLDKARVSLEIAAKCDVPAAQYNLGLLIAEGKVSLLQWLIQYLLFVCLKPNY